MLSETVWRFKDDNINIQITEAKPYMLQVVDKNEIAERKPYKFSEKVSAKIRQRRKEREQNRKNMAQIIVRIDTLDEIVPGDIIYGNNLCNTLKI